MSALAETLEAAVEPDTALLERIEQRLLWLAVRIIDHANRERPRVGGIKVGGHPASSASMTSIMTALWFRHLGPEDRVAVKPHASPVLHAMYYLLGRLDRDYLTQLRAFHGLQAYPSRTKDVFPVDFSTGSVGHGAVGPLFAAAVRRYVDTHFEARPHSRFVALLGDAELDEGNIWEALADPAAQELGNVMWVVDLNRQSLDRVVPGIRIQAWNQVFEAHGWHVEEVKYGSRLQAVFDQPGGTALRRRLDEMTNEEYQSLYVGPEDAIAGRLAGSSRALRRLLSHLSPGEVVDLVRNLGGHDLDALTQAFRRCDDVSDRPSVVFAYTVKGHGLPIAGDPQNHAALLTGEQIDALRAHLGLTEETEWDSFADGSPEAGACRATAARLARPPSRDVEVPAVPHEVGVSTGRPVSTQESFGRLLTQLSRDDQLARHLVTTAPDVATSTNLAGWINKVGLFAPAEQPNWFGSDRIMRWVENPAGQHIELGISEMNLMSMLGQLGLSRELHDACLLPVGTVYDPFVCRGLDALVYALYCGARFVMVGTPSGITLSPEGGAHQSSITPSIGLELPGMSYVEPTYATPLDWLFCDALQRIGDPAGEATYLRLTTRPLDQSPFELRRQQIDDDERLRADVLAGGYILREPNSAVTGPLVHLAGCGPAVTELLVAADHLAEEGVRARVVDLTSPDRLYREWRGALRHGARSARHVGDDTQLGRLFPLGLRSAPIVTAHDAASHALGWLGSVFGAVVVPLGVDEFGQSGTIPELYDEYDIDAGAVVNAALIALDRADAANA